MESTQYKKPLFPVSRLQTTDEFRYFVTYGGTPAEDLLECVSTIKEPVVLLLGCGDLRSILYSIWKNFNVTKNSKKGSNGDKTSKEPCRFTRVKFVMTDYCAAVLAKDILLLYLCVQRPKEEATNCTAKWLGAIWSIWYCHELLSHHERTLSSALSALVGFGTGLKAWSSSDNPIGSFVSFTSKYMLRDICDVWKMWQTKSFGVKSVDSVKADRLHERKISKADFSTADEPLHEYYGPILSKTKDFERRQEAMKSEVSSYDQSGTVFAECVLNESFVPDSAKTSVNHTFYERPDGGYSVYHDILPFRSYHHAFEFSPSKLLAAGVAPSVVSKLPVPEKSFEKYPLLANSVQQLALWLYSCASIFTQCSSDCTDEPRISFTFHCSEAIHFCRELQNSYHGPKLQIERVYDVIHTATLCEIVSLSNILLYATPLLKLDGLLYTGTLKAVGVRRTTKAYIEHCTGINTKLMPIIYGIRALSYDKSGYGSLLPATPDQRALHGKFHFTPHIIIWKRVVLRHALRLSHLGAASNFCDSLIAALLTSVSLKENVGPQISATSAIRALQMFVAQADVDTTNYNYWFRLSDLVGVLPQVAFMGGKMKRFLPDLQMQAYLHDLHIHLAVKESCCPTCRGLRMYEFLGQYCIELDMSVVKDRFGFIVPHLHEGELKIDDDDATYHCVSSLALTRESKGSKKVKLHFYCPVTFDQNGHTVTLIDINDNGNRTLFSGKLADFRVRGHFKHSFDAPLTRVPKHMPTSFGSLTSHLGNGHFFESEISFSEKAFDVYSTSKQLEPRRISPYDIELSCGEHKIDVSYPYCIDYNSLSLKVSKKNKTIAVHAKRTAYDFEQEVPVYMSDPNNPFLLPLMTFDKKTVAEFCRSQFSDEEVAVRSSPDAPPLVKIKNIVADLLQKEEAFFFTYSEPGGSNILLAVNNRVFDYSRKTPAIDLSFCSAKHGSPVFPIWSTMVESLVMSDIPVELYQLLERVLKYFAKRTAPLVSPTASNERQELLSHWKLSPCFTRAVIYPIYFYPEPEVKNLPTIDDLASHILSDCDPEIRESYRKLRNLTDLDLHEGYERMKKREKESKCSYCGQTSENLRKCTRCQAVQYCNKDCQQKHWKLHKVSCKESTTIARPPSTITTNTKDGAAASTTTGSATTQAKNRPPTSMSDSSSGSGSGGGGGGSDDGPKPFISLGIPEIIQCHYCSRILTMVKKCGGCLKTNYCGKHCQELHWKYGHKNECTAALRGKTSKTGATHLPEYSSFTKQQGPAWREVKPTDEDEIETKCTFCGRQPSELIVCHCEGALYCGSECRKSDWEKHRGICRCKNCKKSTSLMMCPCVRAAYCGRTCQKQDWPNHRPFCPLNKKKEQLLYD